MTGLASTPDGYVCVLSPAFIGYLSPDLHMKSLHYVELMRDGHSIVFRDGKCYVASAGTDSIVEFSPFEGERTFWQATESMADTIHLNSLLWDDSGLWVSAFGPKKAELWRSADEGYVLNVETGGRILEGIYHPHSICRDAGAISVCESSRMRILSSAGDAVSLPLGYLRGLVVSGCEAVVGVTKGRRQSKSTGLVDNTADPGIQVGDAGLALLTRANDSASLTYTGEFIDLGAYGDEIYDVIVQI